MALKFFNIRSGESRVAEEEPQIAAFLESSDRSTNITQGQDFGWRLAPEVVAELEDLKRDTRELERIAHLYKKDIGELTEADLIYHISRDTPEALAPIANDDDYADAYNDALRKYQLEANAKAEREAAKRAEVLGLTPADLGEGPTTTEEVVTTTTTQSIEDLEAELARRKAEQEQTTTTTTVKKPTGNSNQNR